MFDNFKKDISRYRKNVSARGFQKSDLYLLFDQGLWAVAVYRFGRWAHACKIPIIRQLLKIIAFILFKMIEISTGISIPASAEIGKGLYVGHFGSIIFHSDVKIGENFSVVTGVTIGTKGLGNTGTPVIGNNVYVGVGAKVLGGIRIGNNVKIGANAVVITDVPDGATAVGIPAKVVKQKDVDIG